MAKWQSAVEKRNKTKKSLMEKLESSFLYEMLLKTLFSLTHLEKS